MLVRVHHIDIEGAAAQLVFGGLQETDVGDFACLAQFVWRIDLLCFCTGVVAIVVEVIICERQIRANTGVGRRCGINEDGVGQGDGVEVFDGNIVDAREISRSIPFVADGDVVAFALKLAMDDLALV